MSAEMIKMIIGVTIKAVVWSGVFGTELLDLSRLAVTYICPDSHKYVIGAK